MSLFGHRPFVGHRQEAAMKRSIQCQKPSSGMGRSTAAAVATCGLALLLAVVTIPSAQGQKSEPRYTILHSFNDTDGSIPQAGLVQAAHGARSSKSRQGETDDAAQLWRARRRAGAAALVQATNGTFYGTVIAGGAKGDGTVFKITPGGTLTTLHNFDGTDGANPVATLVQASDGKFYGTTFNGGANGLGTIFAITAEGTLTTLHHFDGAEGSPHAGLLEDTNGKFYGTTQLGGANSRGTVFSLSLGLGPFVETLPTSGKAGAKVIILGASLTGTSSVTFNRTAATFRVVSSTEITTTVPNGATTGPVEVTTPSGTLKSNVVFRVRKWGLELFGTYYRSMKPPFGAASLLAVFC
jgi:uncharacterized repeat protein (TIGR03803 family)